MQNSALLFKNNNYKKEKIFNKHFIYFLLFFLSLFI